LDGIHEDLNATAQKRTISSSPDDPAEEARFELLPDYQASYLAWEKYMARNASVIVSLFQGQYRSRLSCLTCKTTSTTYNTFMSLSLPIPSKRAKLPGGGVTLYQCLDYFVKEEILEKSEAWYAKFFGYQCRNALS
jgi:ubiquitin carboxyl-terminal hydrolase 8